MFEAVGAHAAGKITDEDLCEYENKACPTCGFLLWHVYSEQYELPDRGAGNGTSRKRYDPGSLFGKTAACKTCGHAGHGAGKEEYPPARYLTEDAILNALTVDMALGCSTNSMLHLPAIAHEIGMDLRSILQIRSARKHRISGHLAPAGHTYIEDLNEAGGVYAVMNELNKKGLLNTDCMTVTGKTIGENIAGCENKIRKS